MKKKIKNIVVKGLVFVLSFAFGMFLAKATKAQDVNALLWKIEGNGLEAPSYLYGTIHAICQEDYFMKESVKEALDNTGQIVLELDMDDPQFMAKMQKNILNAGMKNISPEFNEEDKALVNEFLKANFGADLTQLGIVKPFGLVAMVVQKTIQCSEMASYEQEFIKVAAEKEVELIGLETVEFQTSLFDNEPMEVQIKMLVDGIKDFEEGQEEFKKMVDYYKAEDLEGMQMLVADSPQFAGFEDILLTNRNKDWIPKIGDIVKDQSSFIAVGALHLPGENGVISLLKKAGYSITAAD